MKIHLVLAESFRTDGRTKREVNRNDRDNGRLLQFCERAANKRKAPAGFQTVAGRKIKPSRCQQHAVLIITASSDADMQLLSISLRTSN
jgi:hypothetical protein